MCDRFAGVILPRTIHHDNKGRRCNAVNLKRGRVGDVQQGGPGQRWDGGKDHYKSLFRSKAMDVLELYANLHIGSVFLIFLIYIGHYELGDVDVLISPKENLESILSGESVKWKKGKSRL